LDSLVTNANASLQDFEIISYLIIKGWERWLDSHFMLE
jgi:hypothetical protein